MKKQLLWYICITVLFLCLMVGIFIRRNLTNKGDFTIPTASAPASSADGCININTATADQLKLLPGIGPALAEQIIAYRTDNGPFKEISEIMNVSGIAQKKFDEIAKYIRVGDTNENPGS